MFSIVTACMNRESHLLQSLPRWLQLQAVQEVIVVDWCNANPLTELTQIDPRIKVIRVEGESRWILAYAYNLGIGRAMCDFIVKCDADCVPGRAVEECRPDGQFFYAGHWKSGAAVGKASVNGQCVVAKWQFEKVNGYSEIIRTYGRDDEDFYDRLIASGLARREICPATFDLIAHSDEERMRNQVDSKAVSTVEEFLERNLSYNEMRNYFVGRQMPWGPWFLRASYQREGGGDRFEVVRRNQAVEIRVPPALSEAARLFSLRHVVGKAWNLPPAVREKLDERACVALLVEKLDARPRAVGGDE